MTHPRREIVWIWGSGRRWPQWSARQGQLFPADTVHVLVALLGLLELTD
jgi:hypothetical protein